MSGSSHGGLSALLDWLNPILDAEMEAKLSAASASDAEMGEYFRSDDFALDAAERGISGPLVALLRTGCASPTMQRLAADVIERKVIRRRRRTKNHAVLAAKTEVARIKHLLGERLGKPDTNLAYALAAARWRLDESVAAPAHDRANALAAAIMNRRQSEPNRRRSHRRKASG